MILGFGGLFYKSSQACVTDQIGRKCNYKPIGGGEGMVVGKGFKDTCRHFFLNFKCVLIILILMYAISNRERERLILRLRLKHLLHKDQDFRHA
jgi:hypothetical protein